MASFPRSLNRLLTVLGRLPGVGPKSATRLAFYFLQAPTSFASELAESLLEMKNKIKTCERCFNVTENNLCEVCQDGGRNEQQICVVERAIDLLAVESVGVYKGVYHVLGGVLNPLEHVTPEDLKIAELVDRLREVLAKKEGQVEIIMATNPTMEGEATGLYIKKKLEEFGERIKITRIGSGLPIGADLEFADMATINQALTGRRQW